MIRISSKRSITFYLSLDLYRKKLFTKSFCYSRIKKKDNPEFDKYEINDINDFDYTITNDIMQGKSSIEDYLKVFEKNEEPNKEELFTKEYTQTILNNKYNPYYELENTKKIENLNYEQMKTYKYFSAFDNFLQGLNKNSNNQNNMNPIQKENIDKFIKCLCKIYHAHNIHERINNEISKKTNLLLLKGDHFFSLGYFSVSQIGNQSLIRLYSKIAEIFSRKFFHLKKYQDVTNSEDSKEEYMNLLIKKYIGFIHYGCCGLYELHSNNSSSGNNFLINNNKIIKELSFKYGLLLYLREELDFLKNKSCEYYTKIEDLYSTFLLYSENFANELLSEKKSEIIKLRIKDCISNSKYIEKYKYVALNVSSDLIQTIDNLKLSADYNKQSGVEDMKNYIRMICKDVENLARM